MSSIWNKVDGMFQAKEKIIVLWDVGSAEDANIVWGKGEVLEIDQKRTDDGVVSAVLSYAERCSFAACQFETELLREEGNIK